jgi:hypothetical protein
VELRLGTDDGNIDTNAKSAAKALQDAIAGLKAAVNGQLARLQSLANGSVFLNGSSKNGAGFNVFNTDHGRCRGANEILVDLLLRASTRAAAERCAWHSCAPT